MAVERKKGTISKIAVKGIPKKSVLSVLTKEGNARGEAAPRKITSYMKSVMTVEHYPGPKETKIKRAVRKELQKGYVKSMKHQMKSVVCCGPYTKPKSVLWRQNRNHSCNLCTKRCDHVKRRARHLVVLKSRYRAPYGQSNLAIRHFHNHPGNVRYASN